MAITDKVAFELEMIKILQLPKGVTWFTLHCAYGEVPKITCEYEVQDGEFPKVNDDGVIETKQKKYTVVLKEIEEEDE